MVGQHIVGVNGRFDTCFNCRRRALVSRCSLRRRPKAQMLQDTLHDISIHDQRDYAHRPFAARTFKWIDFINLLNQARPRRSGAGCDFLRKLPFLRHWRGCKCRCPLISNAVGVPADVAHQMLVAIWDNPTSTSG